MNLNTTAAGSITPNSLPSISINRTPRYT